MTLRKAVYLGVVSLGKSIDANVDKRNNADENDDKRYGNCVVVLCAGAKETRKDKRSPRGDRKPYG